jgi:hypothetical protein
MLGIECSRSGVGPLSLRAADPARVERPERVAFWRASAERPVVVRADAADLVLRVSARRPLPPSRAGSVPIVLQARVTNGGAPGRVPSVVSLAAARELSPFDRYEGGLAGQIPTDAVAFHVLVPFGHTLVIGPKGPPVDLSLAELNASGEPVAAPSYAAQGRGPTASVVPTLPEDEKEHTYVARRPSNWRDFDDRARGVVRIARRIVDRPVPEPRPPSFRVRRPRSPGAIAVGARLFEPASATFTVEVPKRGAVPLPLRLYAPEPLEVTVQIDGGAPHRRRIGAVEHVTTSRTFRASREVRAFVMLGDDLQPGRHSVTFKVPPGKRAWVHMPWVKVQKPPRPHWIESEFSR